MFYYHMRIYKLNQRYAEEYKGYAYIPVRQATKGEVDKIGRKGDTYDDIINILLVVYKAEKLKEGITE